MLKLIIFVFIFLNIIKYSYNNIKIKIIIRYLFNSLFYSYYYILPLRFIRKNDFLINDLNELEKCLQNLSSVFSDLIYSRRFSPAYTRRARSIRDETDNRRERAASMARFLERIRR